MHLSLYVLSIVTCPGTYSADALHEQITKNYISMLHHHDLFLPYRRMRQSCLMKVRKLVGPSFMVPLTPRKRKNISAIRSNIRR